MFTKILVPLDGSALAERALKPAFAMAKAFGSQVTLMRVVVPEEVPLAAGVDVAYPDFELLQASQNRRWEEAEAYLSGVRAEWEAADIQVRLDVTSGAPPEMIIEEANRLGANLIVMSTHGRSGISRLIYGSVAEAVLRGAHVPVLLVPVRQ